MNNLNTSAETLLFQKTHIFFHQINLFITYETDQSKSFSTVPFPGIPPKTSLTFKVPKWTAPPQSRSYRVFALTVLLSRPILQQSRLAWTIGNGGLQELSTEVDIGHGGFVNCTSQPGGQAGDWTSRVLDVVVVSHARFPPFTLCFYSVCHSCLHRCDLLRCGESGMGERKRW